MEFCFWTQLMFNYTKAAVIWTSGTFSNTGSLLLWGMAGVQYKWQYSLAAQATACGQCSSVAGSQPAPLGWSHLGPTRNRTQHRLSSPFRKCQKPTNTRVCIFLWTEAGATVSFSGLPFTLCRILDKWLERWGAGRSLIVLLTKWRFFSFLLRCCNYAPYIFSLSYSWCLEELSLILRLARTLRADYWKEF